MTSAAPFSSPSPSTLIRHGQADKRARKARIAAACERLRAWRTLQRAGKLSSRTYAAFIAAFYVVRIKTFTVRERRMSVVLYHVKAAADSTTPNEPATTNRAGSSRCAWSDGPPSTS